MLAAVCPEQVEALRARLSLYLGSIKCRIQDDVTQVVLVEGATIRSSEDKILACFGLRGPELPSPQAGMTAIACCSGRKSNQRSPRSSPALTAITTSSTKIKRSQRGSPAVLAISLQLTASAFPSSIFVAVDANSAALDFSRLSQSLWPRGRAVLRASICFDTFRASRATALQWSCS
jgi:hypothetical protein